MVREGKVRILSRNQDRIGTIYAWQQQPPAVSTMTYRVIMAC